MLSKLDMLSNLYMLSNLNTPRNLSTLRNLNTLCNRIMRSRSPRPSMPSLNQKRSQHGGTTASATSTAQSPIKRHAKSHRELCYSAL